MNRRFLGILFILFSFLGTAFAGTIQGDDGFWQVNSVYWDPGTKILNVSGKNLSGWVRVALSDPHSDVLCEANISRYNANYTSLQFSFADNIYESSCLRKLLGQSVQLTLRDKPISYGSNANGFALLQSVYITANTNIPVYTPLGKTCKLSGYVNFLRSDLGHSTYAECMNRILRRN